MAENTQHYRGCLLGMAVGDAMGYTIDDDTWEQIQKSYGRNGLLGYDLQSEEYAQVTSYTHIAAYLCNGLLLSVARSRTDPLPYCKVAMKEWVRSQQFYRDPDKTHCWIAKLPYLRRGYCRDSRMLATHRKECYGTLDTPINDSTTPSSLTMAVAVAMFYNAKRMPAQQVGTLTAELMALTHGNPETILSGVVLAYALAGILQEPEADLADQFRQAISVMEGQFGSRFPQAEGLAQYLQMIIDLALEGEQFPQAGMEQMRCLDADQCLAGAIFAALTCPEDFDTGIITAVNHSGVSTAVGAIAGAILGAKLGEEALPEFYLESLESCKALRVLADDMVCATPALGLFDETWDEKYTQGNVPAL